MDALSHGEADLVDVVEFFNRRLQETFEGTELARQNSRSALADMADSKSVNQTGQVTRLARGDLIQDVARGFFRHTFERNQIFQRQAVNVGNVAHQLLLDQLIGQREPQSFDAHRAPRSKMQNSANQL